MNWKLKAHAMAVMSRTPGGKALYKKVQKWCGTNQLDTEESAGRAIELVRLVKEAGHSPRNGIFFEIGTGWRPFVPFVLYLAGAARIVTVDVNPWLDEASAFETARALRGQLTRLAHEANIDPEYVQDRYLSAINGRNNLLQLLAGFSVEYRYPGDASHTGIPSSSFGFVCSSNVLEHIPPRVLASIHAESFRILRSGGLVVHRFNPQDHFTSIDKTITGANFLRYSTRAWYWYGGSGLSYHNRLRCVEHQSMFEAAGFKTAVARTRTDRRALIEIENGRLTVHREYSRYSPEELAADYMWYVGRKPT